MKSGKNIAPGGRSRTFAEIVPLDQGEVKKSMASNYVLHRKDQILPAGDSLRPHFEGQPVWDGRCFKKPD